MPQERAQAGKRFQWLAVALCAVFLASVARFYYPGLGFSALLIIPQRPDMQLPALQQLPHYEYPPHIAYDGFMYVQLAMEPLLRDPAIDHALDAPAYRARRILFSWTAYALGLGRPAWILQAYALQNVLSWLMLAWLLTRWIRPDTPTGLAIWTASMFSHGLLVSVRMSLLDGPSLLLLAFAVAASARGRSWLSALVLGIATLGRETNVLGAVTLPWPKGVRGWLRLAACGVLVVLPLLIWQDYIWSIYRGASASAGASQLTVPVMAYLQKWQVTFGAIRQQGLFSPGGYTLLVVIALTAQVAFVGWSRAIREPWWRMAAAFAVLLMLVHPVVWEGFPGAVTRVVLPLKFGVNILLVRTRPRGFWWWVVLCNLDVVAGQAAIPNPLLPLNL
jgi:hypothetical protein